MWIKFLGSPATCNKSHHTLVIILVKGVKHAMILHILESGSIRPRIYGTLLKLVFQAACSSSDVLGIKSIMFALWDEIVGSFILSALRLQSTLLLSLGQVPV